MTFFTFYLTSVLLCALGCAFSMWVHVRTASGPIAVGDLLAAGIMTLIPVLNTVVALVMFGGLVSMYLDKKVFGK